MSHLIILITDTNREAVYKSGLKIEQVFGSESVVVEGTAGEPDRYVRGESAYLTGDAAAFRKLVVDNGELWTCTNPMIGNWKQYVSAEEEGKAA